LDERPKGVVAAARVPKLALRQRGGQRLGDIEADVAVVNRLIDTPSDENGAFCLRISASQKTTLESNNVKDYATI
jgi:hypothetical protein